MKPSLQVRLSQHLALTPQLQQSIRLLQLSTLELHQEVEQMLEQNPFLEVEEDAGTPYDAPAERSTRVSRRVSMLAMATVPSRFRYASSVMLLRKFEAAMAADTRSHNPRERSWLEGVRQFFSRMGS